MISTGPVLFREAGPADQSILDLMNVTASFGSVFSESEQPVADKFLTDNPYVAALSKDFGRNGDIGVIAEDDQGQLLGAVWGRVYARTDYDGPMQEHPFEIIIAVREAARSRGIGRQLLECVAVAAAAEGREDLSLVVHAESPALRLYQAAGYEPLQDGVGQEIRIDNCYVPMVRKLNNQAVVAE